MPTCLQPKANKCQALPEILFSDFITVDIFWLGCIFCNSTRSHQHNDGDDSGYDNVNNHCFSYSIYHKPSSALTFLYAIIYVKPHDSPVKYVLLLSPHYR